MKAQFFAGLILAGTACSASAQGPGPAEAPAGNAASVQVEYFSGPEGLDHKAQNRTYMPGEQLLLHVSTRVEEDLTGRLVLDLNAAAKVNQGPKALLVSGN